MSAKDPHGVPERIDISDLVSEICARLGINSSIVASMAIDPRELTVEVFDVNETGGKFVDKDNDKPATHQISFDVRT